MDALSPVLDLVTTSVMTWLLTTGATTAGGVQPVQVVNWATWRDSTWIEVLGEPQRVSDPTAIAAVQQHLDTLAILGMPPANQGVWVQAGNQILADHRGTEPIPAASLTKIATTLAAYATWGVDHRFDTLIGITGRVQDGVVQGDLVVQGGGDPLFVWEEAIALGNALNQRGIRRVTGNLIIAGDFAMNFEANPQRSGELLRQGLNATLWTAEAATQYRQLPVGTPQPQVAIEGAVQVMATPPQMLPVLRHRSLSLTQILKAMNIFSNNFIADALAADLGGGPAVAQKAALAARIPPDEVQLINGSGLGEDNRLSPRAVTAMLTTLQAQLRAHDLTVADLFPVAGRERGTLGDRQLVPGAAVKTGTLDRVSALAGVIPTGDRGPVWFTIIDIGTADLKTLHRGQDRLLNRLVSQWGAGVPAANHLQPSDRIPGYQSLLGDPARNQPL